MPDIGSAGIVYIPMPPGGTAGQVLAKVDADNYDATWANPSGAGGGIASLSAGTTQATGAQVVFADSNGVSFGVNGGTVTASVAGGGGAAGSIAALASTLTLGMLVFAASNGVSFGMNGSTMTASHNALTSQSNQAFSAPGGSSSFQTLTFANSNGVSWSNSNGSLVGSVQTNYAATDVTSGRAGTATGFTGTNVSASMTLNTNGLSLQLSAPSGGGGAAFTGGISGGNTSGNTGTVSNQLVFAGGNNITLSGSTNAGGMTVTVSGANAGNAQTLYATGNTTVNSSGTQALSSLLYRGYGVLSIGTSNGSVLFSTPDPVDFTQLSVGVSTGGNTSGNTGLVTGQLVLAGGSNITLSGSTNGGSQTVTIIGASGGGGGGGVNFGVSTMGNTAGSTGTVSTGNVVLVGSGPISLSQSTGAAGSAATITINAPATSSLVAGANITVSTAGSTISIIGASVAPSPLNVTAGTTSGNLQTVAFSDSNGVSFGLNGSTVTASHNGLTSQSGQAFSAQGGSSAFQTLSFANGNGVSFSNSNGSLQASVSPETPFGISAGTQSVSTGTLVLANSNGISFGMSGSSQITASHNGITQQSTQPVAFSAPGGSSNFSTLNFANSNGVSWTNTGGSIAASVKTDYAGTSTGFSGTNVSASVTLNTDGLALRLSAPSGGGAAFSGGISGGNTAGDTGTVSNQLVFAGGNNITVSGSTNAGGMSVTISGANVGGAQTGISGIVVSNTTYTSGTVSFSNANGISFGSSAGQAVTASYTVPSVAGLISAINLSAGTTSNNLTQIVFSNSNGLAFGLNGSTITGSYTQQAQTNQTLGLYAVGNTTGQSSSSTVDARSLSFDGAGIVSVGLSAGTMRVSATQSNQAVSGQNGSFAFQTLSLSNANGISFGTSAGSAITASHNGLTTARASNDAIGLNTAQTNVTWTVNSSGLSLNAAGYAGTATTFNGTNASGSMTLNSNGLRLDVSVAAGGGVNPAASASNGSFNFTTLNFSNANNVTFGTSAGGIITASVAAPGAAAENNWVNLLGANTSGNTTASGSTIGYSGINLTLSGTNGSVVNISAPATSSLSATGMLSISTNGSTISIGVGRTISGLVLAPFAGLGGPIPFAQSSISLGQNSLYMYPVQIEDYLTCDHFRIPVLMTNSSSAAASVQKGLTYQVGIYTRHSTNATILSRHYSSSYTMAASHNSNASWMLSLITGIGNSTSYNTLTASSAGLNLSASLHGPREFIMPVSSLFTPGEYIMAMLVSSSSVGAGGAVLNNSNMAVAYQTFNQVGASTNATGTGFYKSMAMGTYSATTGALPASISVTQINQLGTMPFMFAAMGTV